MSVLQSVPTSFGSVKIIKTEKFLKVSWHSSLAMQIALQFDEFLTNNFNITISRILKFLSKTCWVTSYVWMHIILGNLEMHSIDLTTFALQIIMVLMISIGQIPSNPCPPRVAVYPPAPRLPFKGQQIWHKIHCIIRHQLLNNNNSRLALLILTICIEMAAIC